MITYLLPTRDRPQTLLSTLEALGALDAAAHDRIGGAEVIVVDNASTPPVRLPKSLLNGIPLKTIVLESNRGAAARNIGVEHANGQWIVMLDDDSHPLTTDHVEVLLEAPDDVAAIGAEIVLPNGSREAGGLPEVIIGCGAAIRRRAFLEVQGYDPTFDYYVEEYDLCAKFLLRQWRVMHDCRFRVLHEKIATHRDMNRILHRLVRNNCWVTQRYAPPEVRTAELQCTISRYASIAVKECAADGFAAGVAELLQTIHQQPQHTMSPEIFERFTGLAQARATFVNDPAIQSRKKVAIVEAGKGALVIRQALAELGARLVDDSDEADVLVIGTMSPGPMLDAFERRSAEPVAAGRPVLCAWWPVAFKGQLALEGRDTSHAALSTHAMATMP